MRVYLLTTAYADNLHEMGLDDLVQAVLYAGEVYATLEAAQEAAQAQLTEMTQDDDVPEEHNTAEAFAWEAGGQDNAGLATTWRGTSTCLDALVREVRV